MTSLSENTVVTTSGGLVELGYKEITSAVTITGTVLGSGTEIISPLSIVCDGSSVLVEFYAPQTVMDGQQQISISLYRDGVQVKSQWFVQNNVVAGVTRYDGIYAAFRDTPSAGVHTYSVYAVKTTGNTAQILAGGTNNTPTFLKVNKIVQASQFIVPLASAPLVTSLPSAPIDGQEIRYVADATNGIIWNLRYRAAATSPFQWEFVGGPPLTAFVGGGALSVTATSNTTSPSFTIPLLGKYLLAYSGLVIAGSAGQYSTIAPLYNGSNPLKWDNTSYAFDELEAGSGHANYYVSVAATSIQARFNTAGGTLALRHRVDAGTGYFLRRQISAIPVAVGS